MEPYLIIALSFIISLCRVLKLAMLIRLWQHKKLHPKASLKEIESFETSIKKSYNLFWKTNQSQ